MKTPDPVDEEIARIRELVRNNLRNLAEERLGSLQESHPDDPRLRRLQADAFFEWGDNVSAYRIMLELLESTPHDVPLLIQAMTCSVALGDADQVRRLGNELFTLQPGRSGLLAKITQSLERIGDVDEAEKYLGLLLSSPETHETRPAVRGYLQARLLAARKDIEGAASLLSDLVDPIEAKSLPEKDAPQFRESLFLLAKYRDRLGDYDGAWAAATKAHEDDGQVWDIDQYEQVLADTRAVFTKEMAPQLAHADEVSSEPLVILGNPRSGTTLLDTILGMHPQVAMGGELSASSFVQVAVPRLTDSFLPFPTSMVDLRVSDANALGRIYENQTQGLGNGRRYLSNKSLGMHLQLGMMSLALPKMRVVNLFRNALDNCVSCYTMNLLSSGHGYTNSLETLGRTWIARHQMQKYWPEVLEVPMIEMHYEDMVADQEHQTRRLLEFLDVAFDKACLEFHESSRLASTLSYEQVQQKMYTTSKGRWRNYEKHLGPLIDRLEPYL
ncbi:MAG: hypothetical protein CMJ23_08405 [Phycisphaerae bacterium]|nr:hypothetical protein [Phycisphaerae bacterium]